MTDIQLTEPLQKISVQISPWSRLVLATVPDAKKLQSEHNFELVVDDLLSLAKHLGIPT